MLRCMFEGQGSIGNFSVDNNATLNRSEWHRAGTRNDHTEGQVVFFHDTGAGTPQADTRPLSHIISY